MREPEKWMAGIEVIHVPLYLCAAGNIIEFVQDRVLGRGPAIFPRAEEDRIRLNFFMPKHGCQQQVDICYIAALLAESLFRLPAEQNGIIVGAGIVIPY